MSITVLIEVIITIVGMVFLCFFCSGIANIPGSIFEKKSTPEQRAAAEKGVVRGGKKAV